MRAMILSAGRGERLRPLTDRLPKPLVEVAGKPLIEHHLENLEGAGFREVVINVSHLGELIVDALGDGQRWGLKLHYSREPEGALETGGGIFQALPHLGSDPFLVINGDIWTDFPLANLRAVKCDAAHLVMVPNPAFNPDGDFSLHKSQLRSTGDHCLTFSGLGVYHPGLFEGQQAGRWSIVPLLREHMDKALVTGEVHHGAWFDSGTASRLDALRTAAAIKSRQ